MTFHHAKEGIVLQSGIFSDRVTSISIGKPASVCAHGVMGCTLRCGMGDPSSSPMGTHPVDRGPSTGVPRVSSDCDFVTGIQSNLLRECKHLLLEGFIDRVTCLHVRNKGIQTRIPKCKTRIP